MHGSSTYTPHHPGTPLGTGAGSSARSAAASSGRRPACARTATRPRCLQQNKPGGAPGGARRRAAGRRARRPPPGEARARASAAAPAARGPRTRLSRSGGGGGGERGSSGEPRKMSDFLTAHLDRFASCKTSQLRRATAEVSAGVAHACDAGRVRDASARAGLRDFARKIAELKLLQGDAEGVVALWRRATIDGDADQDVREARLVDTSNTKVLVEGGRRDVFFNDLLVHTHRRGRVSSAGDQRSMDV